MHARNRGYGAGAAPAQLPGKQVRRPVVRAGALYTRPARKRPSVMERKLNKVLKNQDNMQKGIAEMQKDITQLKTDTTVNKALVLVNLMPAASLVLGVLYFVYNHRA